VLKSNALRVCRACSFGIAVISAATALTYPLNHVSPVISLGVLYVLAVVVVSTFWGLMFGIGTSVLSAAAFPAGKQGIGPTAAYLLSKRPCRVIIETEKRPARAREHAIVAA
jgi:hypothetical protein